MEPTVRLNNSPEKSRDEVVGESPAVEGRTAVESTAASSPISPINAEKFPDLGIDLNEEIHKEGEGDRGKDAILEGRFEEAVGNFQNAIRSCNYALNKGIFNSDELTEKKHEIISMKISYCNNCSHALMKLDRMQEAITFLNDALELDKFNTKALYRRAKCAFILQDYDVALEFLDILEHRLTVGMPGAAAQKALRQDVIRARLEHNRDFKTMARTIVNNLASLETTGYAEGFVERMKRAPKTIQGYLPTVKPTHVYDVFLKFWSFLAYIYRCIMYFIYLCSDELLNSAWDPDIRRKAEEHEDQLLAAYGPTMKPPPDENPKNK